MTKQHEYVFHASCQKGILVSQASEWIQLKTLLFESPARVSMYKSMPDVPASLEEHTRCQGKRSGCFCFISAYFSSLWETQKHDLEINPLEPQNIIN